VLKIVKKKMKMKKKKKKKKKQRMMKRINIDWFENFYVL
jgi:hypothetical protein